MLVKKGSIQHEIPNRDLPIWKEKGYRPAEAPPDAPESPEIPELSSSKEKKPEKKT